MTATQALDMLERGEAKAVLTTVLILKHGGKVWYSFDGHQWTETADKRIKEEVSDD